MYQLVGDLLRPFTFCYLLTLVGLVALWWKRPAERRRRLAWFTAAFLLLSIICMPIVCYLAQGSLEWWYPPRQEIPDDTQAIVILAGYLRAADSVQPWEELGFDSLVRCVRGRELLASLQASRDAAGEPNQALPKIIVSGGVVDPEETQTPIAIAMADFLEQLGVPREQIVIESGSTTTYENARNVAEYLRKEGLERVVLVTEARHLLRSDLCFRKQGVQVIPRGADYRATVFRFKFESFLPDPHAALRIEKVTHEWLGLAWYWLHGRI